MKFGELNTLWHTLPGAEVLTMLKTTSLGLGTPDAVDRFHEIGPNEIGRGRQRGWAFRFLSQFHNLFIYVLLISALVTFLLGHPVDTGVILAVVLINALFGFVQEGRAEQALAAVQSMVSDGATVLRGGQRVSVAAKQVVPGDCVVLEPGERVPADLRLLRVSSLKIDEAMLTGESVAADKQISPVAASASLGDRSCMAYSGTLVAAGQGVGVVVATGVQTELGRISTMLRNVEALSTPLTRAMDRFARQLTVAILVIAAAVFGFAVWVRQYDVADAFIAVVGIAVSAIPEGLPVVMTIALAMGVQRMARHKAIVRNLPSVETLGAVSVICSDKTGTLTRNEMSVREVSLDGACYEVQGMGYAPVGAVSRRGSPIDATGEVALLAFSRAAALCNDAHLVRDGEQWRIEGDPMEGALLTLARRCGHDLAMLEREWPRIAEVPFDAAHRFMATLHHPEAATPWMVVKGAPEAVLDRCIDQRHEGGSRPLERAYWDAEVERLASQGYRVLALAARDAPNDLCALDMGDVHGLTLLGLLGMIDPPRAEVRQAVAECRAAGIRVKMITGDHAATAAAIARELGLDDPIRVTTGQEVEHLDDVELVAVARRSTVFARTSPEHKLRLVKALQADRSVIAMTGDGVNDAPALKRADIGVAMGNSGTAAAKEAAGMVLADDNFATIVAAVKEGRTVYANLRKVIAWTLPTNVGQALVIIAAILLGAALPMTPVQVLWVNLVTAVALGLTLAFEPAEPDLMRRPPRRPDAPLLRPFLLWRVAFVSTLFAAGSFAAFEWSLARGDTIDLARTIVVNLLVVFEIFYLFSVRYLPGTSVTLRGLFGTPAVLMGVGGVVLLQLLYTYAPPLGTLFHTAPVDLLTGGLIVLAGVGLLAVLELEKLILRRLGVDMS
ncbi:ATPase, P-type (transporting), HAD superfamily, subfamily IC [Roseateles sp. YR242]|uniref:HAD-IC family P-type ATPase n=1 Tax=Roseateles sp. YR242 TaxID=1855305 RepID=UPI0008C60A6E|nr:ATPase, P-type (transporting), HAD superfamily, subfamily IC [Roseateles sp. YR242]